jgi:hypothetical protein
MFYETGILDSKAYEESLRQQLLHIRDLKNKLGGRSPQYLLGVGAFQSQGRLRPFRDMKFENLLSTLTLLKKLELSISPLRGLVDGLAIYCEWLASSEEWEQIRMNW